MTSWNLKREEEEEVFKKRLLYDGHGSGEDKRLINLLKNLTKFYLTEESNDDVIKLFHLITKDLVSGINAAEKHAKISQMFDRTFANLEEAIEEKTQHTKTVRLELFNLELELEYVEKLKQVNAYPDCQTTEQAMQEIDRKRQKLTNKIERQRTNLRTLVQACQHLQRLLENDEEEEPVSKSITLPDQNMN